MQVDDHKALSVSSVSCMLRFRSIRFEGAWMLLSSYECLRSHARSILLRQPDGPCQKLIVRSDLFSLRELEQPVGFLLKRGYGPGSFLGARVMLFVCIFILRSPQTYFLLCSCEQRSSFDPNIATAGLWSEEFPHG